MYIDVKIELNDELTLLVRSVYYCPGRVGWLSGPADNCYEAEPPEVDWEDNNVLLIYKKGKKELAFDVNHKLADFYIDEIMEYCEYAYRERGSDYD